jgi:hypothetical protein
MSKSKKTFAAGKGELEKFAWHDEGKSHWTAKQIHDKYQTGVKYDFGRFSRDASFDNFPIGHKFRVCSDPYSLKSILEEVTSKTLLLPPSSLQSLNLEFAC